jgi:hypothetical protein
VLFAVAGETCRVLMEARRVAGNRNSSSLVMANPAS